MAGVCFRSRYVDYDDSDTLKWQSLVNKMYTNGTAFKDLDSLNGNKNVFFRNGCSIHRLIHSGLLKYLIKETLQKSIFRF